MENKKQVTAVEWFNQQLVDRQNGDGDSRSWDTILEQAKEMEKQNLESCAIYFMNYALDCVDGVKEISGKKEFERYLDVKFKK